VNRSLLERAEKTPISYAVRYLESPDGRTLVVLGEAHMKLGPAAALGRAIVDSFELRGVESFPAKKVFAGRALWVLIHLPRVLLRVATLGLLKGSTITEAKALTHGVTYEIERDGDIPLGLHVGALYLAVLFGTMFTHLTLTALNRPIAAVTWLTLAIELHMFAIIPALMLRRHRWSWLIHPVVTILTVRDTIMADGTVNMLRAHDDREAVVVMGRAHLPGFTRELVTRYGFTER
jgi:hypothetical protein